VVCGWVAFRWPVNSARRTVPARRTVRRTGYECGFTTGSTFGTAYTHTTLDATALPRTPSPTGPDTDGRCERRCVATTNVGRLYSSATLDAALPRTRLLVQPRYACGWFYGAPDGLHYLVYALPLHAFMGALFLVYKICSAFPFARVPWDVTNGTQIYNTTTDKVIRSPTTPVGHFLRYSALPWTNQLQHTRWLGLRPFYRLTCSLLRGQFLPTVLHHSSALYSPGTERTVRLHSSSPTHTATHTYAASPPPTGAPSHHPYHPYRRLTA